MIALANAGQLRSRSLYPGLWRGLVAAWCPELGIQGQKLLDLAGRNDAVFSSMANTAWTTGGGRAIGRALYFGGSSMASVRNLDMPVFSFSCWFKRDRTSSSSSDRLLLSVVSGGWGVYIDDPGTIGLTKVGMSNCNSTGTVGDTKWHHLVVTYDGATAKFYLEGKLDSSPSYSATFSSSSGAYTIGGRGSGEYFQGYMQQILLYNRVLSASEAAGLAAGRSPLSLRPVRPIRSVQARARSFAVVCG